MRWLSLGSGCTAVGVVAVAFLARGRTTAQRWLDVVAASIGGWTIVAACTFAGRSLLWLSFAEGAALCAIGLCGLIVHEVSLERSLRAAHAALHEPRFSFDGASGQTDGGAGTERPDEFDDDAPRRWRGPLADSYPAAVALVILALVPYLVLTSAMTPLQPILEKSLPLSGQALQLTTGMANAAYAFGTVLAVQFAVHLRGRRMLLVYVTLFVIASVVAASAPTPGLFIGGHVVQGLTTSLMLIAAVPPLVIGWPADKMPFTGATMNLCVFGAVALGPVVGGVQAGAGNWHPLFWIVAGVGAAALLFALLTFEDQPPQDRGAPWDWVAIVLAGGGSAAAFFGASELATHSFTAPIALLPLAAGVAALVVLVALQYHIKHPLMPVRALATTFPIAAIVIVLCAAASSVGLVMLVETAKETSVSPTHLAMLFWPEFGGALLTAMLFGMLFRTRWVPVLALGGTVAVAGGAAVLTGVAHGANSLVVIGSGLIGLGVGASVSPALFIAGFSLRSTQIQRVFALIELLRAAAAFIAPPVLLHVALTVAPSQPAGIKTAIWVCLGVAAGGGLLAAYVFLLGRARLQRPALDRWERGEEPALHSPPLAAGIRPGTSPAPPSRPRQQGRPQRSASGRGHDGDGVAPDRG